MKVVKIIISNKYKKLWLKKPSRLNDVKIQSPAIILRVMKVCKISESFIEMQSLYL